MRVFALGLNVGATEYVNTLSDECPPKLCAPPASRPLVSCTSDCVLWLQRPPAVRSNLGTMCHVAFANPAYSEYLEGRLTITSPSSEGIVAPVTPSTA